MKWAALIVMLGISCVHAGDWEYEQHRQTQALERQADAAELQNNLSVIDTANVAEAYNKGYVAGFKKATDDDLIDFKNAMDDLANTCVKEEKKIVDRCCDK